MAPDTTPDPADSYLDIPTDATYDEVLDLAVEYVISQARTLWRQHDWDASAAWLGALDNVADDALEHAQLADPEVERLGFLRDLEREAEDRRWEGTAFDVHRERDGTQFMVLHDDEAPYAVLDALEVTARSEFTTQPYDSVIEWAGAVCYDTVTHEIEHVTTREAPLDNAFGFSAACRLFRSEAV